MIRRPLCRASGPVAAALLALVAPATSSAQTPTLLRDLVTAPPPEPSSWATDFVEFGGAIWFVASTPTTGRELFRSDGTTAGTGLFREFVPGEGDGSVSIAAVAGGLLYFTAAEPGTGAELWASDGTLAGTRLVRDLVPGPDGSGIAEASAFQGRLFFRANVGGLGFELWSSDGTPAGTTLVRDIRPGTDSSMPRRPTVVGNRLCFVADDGSHGAEWWVTDGTAAGTALLVDAFPGPTESGAEPLGPTGGRLLFRTYNGPDPLWVTDGTSAGTHAIPTVLTGVRSGGVPLGGDLVFLGYDPAAGEELWRSDGSPAGTRRIVDLVPGSGSPGETRLLGVAGGRLLFSLYSPVAWRALWATDGTAAGTAQLMTLADIGRVAVPLGGLLLFAARDATHGEELWRSDGTAAGTTMIADLRPGPLSSFVRPWSRFGSSVVLTARDDVNEDEPWISDGTALGTRLLANVAQNPPSWTDGSLPGDSVDWNGRLVFATRTFAPPPVPWISDGSAGGTRVYHAFTGADPFFQLNEHGNPRLHVVRGELVSISGDLYAGPSSVWLDSGNGPQFRSTITLGLDPWRLPRYASAGGLLWWVTDGLWRVDRGVASRVTLPPPVGSYQHVLELVAAGASVLVVTSESPAIDALYRCDAAGCSRVYVGPACHPSVVVRDRVYFTAYDPATGYELLVTDGTASGTSILDLLPGPASSSARPLAACDGALLFEVDDGLHGPQIWSTFGTPDSTLRLTALVPPLEPGVALVPAGLDRFLFAHDDGVHGREPFLLSPRGATLVVDLAAGPAGSDPIWLGSAGEDVWFEALGALWRTDGTPQGTRRVLDDFDGTGWFAVAGGMVFFDHDDGVHGHEPFVVPAGAVSEPYGEACGVGLRAPWLKASDPVLGRRLIVLGGGAEPAASGLLALGRPASRPLLLAGGCTSYVDPATAAVVHAVADGSRAWQWSVTIPNLPALAGLQLALQSWNGSRANPAGIELSAPVRLVVGGR